jgi:hypothetical protein
MGMFFSFCFDIVADNPSARIPTLVKTGSRSRNSRENRVTVECAKDTSLQELTIAGNVTGKSVELQSFTTLSNPSGVS